jgi:hypothetical protein
MDRYDLAGPKDWSPRDELVRREFKQFLAYFEPKVYRGWLFEYVYPGFFSFYHPKSDFNIFFTPDFNEKDVVDVQVQKNDGSSTDDGGAVPFTVRTSENLFQAVKPWLDKYHPGKGPAMGGPKDWSPSLDNEAHQWEAMRKAFGSHYRGWELVNRSSYGGLAVHKDSPYHVFFGPDWNVPGSLTIEIARRNGEGVDQADIPFIDRSPENLLSILRPWLDKYHPGNKR